MRRHTCAKESMNSTAYAKRTQYKPIDFFFRGIVDAKSKNKKVAFVDAFQILNDRYLGRMSVANYFVIAENSVRINELNVIALEELKNYHLVMRENFYIPEKIVYSVPVSVRFLENDKDFDILLETLKDNEYKRDGLIISFFANTLARLDEEGRKRYARLRRGGYKICISAYGEEYNSLDVFADFSFDYLRCEAQYFDSSASKKRVLQMLVKYCAANKMGLIMEGVDTPAQYARFKKEGVKYVTGRAVSKLSRWVTNEFLKLPELTPEKKAAYEKRLQKDLDAKEREERKELDEMRKAAIARIMEQDANGRIMPLAPRPELAKSPYQVRLEQQKLAAKKAAEERLKIQEAKLVVQNNDPLADKKLIEEMSPIRFQGDVQSALALTFASDKKSELGFERAGAKEEIAKAEEHARELKAQEELTLTAEESGVVAPDRPTLKTSDKKKRKAIRPDFDAEEKLFSEFRGDSMFGGLGMESGMRGFGVTLHIPNKEDTEPKELIGKYNERGQWVDEDGNTYNGYFDVEGNWVEYEMFDRRHEGYYNENAQWVDADGTVYDGYFDEEGRWIDYTYTDANGETVDNGYFDDKIGKWIPFGYFDEKGTYHKL